MGKAKQAIGGIFLLLGAAAYFGDGSDGAAPLSNGDDIERYVQSLPKPDNPKPPLPSILKAREERAGRLKRQDAEDAKMIGGVDDRDCRRAIQCWGEKHVVQAGVACMAQIERLAKYDFEWTESWAETKMSRFKWTNKNDGLIAYFGDKIKFQNGFGAWQHYSYECIYNTITGNAVEVTAWPGRL